MWYGLVQVSIFVKSLLKSTLKGGLLVFDVFCWRELKSLLKVRDASKAARADNVNIFVFIIIFLKIRQISFLAHIENHVKAAKLPVT